VWGKAAIFLTESNLEGEGTRVDPPGKNPAQKGAWGCVTFGTKKGEEKTHWKGIRARKPHSARRKKYLTRALQSFKKKTLLQGKVVERTKKRFHSTIFSIGKEQKPCLGK